MKKILLLTLALIFSLSIVTTASVRAYFLDEVEQKLPKIERATFVNEEGAYYKTVNDVTLYVKLEKEHYVVGDRLIYSVELVNYGDKCIGAELGYGNDYFWDALSINGKCYMPDRGTDAMTMPDYAKTYDVNYSPFYSFSAGASDQELSEYIDSGIKKAGTYTLVVFVQFSYGEFGEEYFEETNSNFTPADDEVYEIFLAIDIPVYESEADIPDIEVPVVPGPEKTKQSYYEKYPEPTKPIIEESTTLAPTTKVTTTVPTTENTTVVSTEAIKQDVTNIPSWIGYIIIALSVGVIITAVITFVVVNKKKK